MVPLHLVREDIFERIKDEISGPFYWNSVCKRANVYVLVHPITDFSELCPSVRCHEKKTVHLVQGVQNDGGRAISGVLTRLSPPVCPFSTKSLISAIRRSREFHLVAYHHHHHHDLTVCHAFTLFLCFTTVSYGYDESYSNKLVFCKCQVLQM